MRTAPGSAKHRPGAVSVGLRSDGGLPEVTGLYVAQPAEQLVA